MSSYTPQTNLSLERSRLIGMVTGGVSYGMYLLLTVQAMTALMERPRDGQKIADNRLTLLCYTLITFALGTICFASEAKFTVMIWIDLRDAPGGPTVIIEDVMQYRINFLALSSAYVAEWLMQALLLYRCFVIWNRARHVMIPMVALYIGMIGAGIVTLVQTGNGAPYYAIPAPLAYLAFQVAHTVLYTILVAKRLLSIRGQMKQALGEYDSGTYNTVILMVVESAMADSIFMLIFLVALAVHSDVLTNICSLSIIQVQGIAQLFIIIRVARGRAATHAWSNPVTAVPTTLAFATTSIAAEETSVARATRPEQDSVESYTASAKFAEV